MELNALTALSPLDGRYSETMADLRRLFSEYSLIYYRTLVEIHWLIELASDKNINPKHLLTNDQKQALLKILDQFSEKEAESVTKKRELQQTKIINQYTSKGLVFALVGEYHLRKNSPIFTKLRVKKAILVRPSFKWKDELNHVENIKKSDITYIVKFYKK